VAIAIKKNRGAHKGAHDQQSTPGPGILMTASMTAFSRKQSRTEYGELAWELRSLNHRYLETSLRIPEALRGIEANAREAVNEQISRGKIEATLRYRPGAPVGDAPLKLDESLLARLMSTLQRLNKDVANTAPLALLRLLQWPGLIVDSNAGLEPVQAASLDLLQSALADLVESRLREGAKLGSVIVQRLDDIGEITSQVRAHLPEIEAAYRNRLQQRIESFVDKVDNYRMEQEIAMLLQKLDITEELDRIDSHVTEARHVLSSNEPVGRRLDFLMQEFNREANTMGSKAGSEIVTRAAVDLKVLIEQMREQVQNIE